MNRAESFSNVVLAVMIVFAILILLAVAIVELVQGYGERWRQRHNRQDDLERLYQAPAYDREAA